ncbi:hypothetical protein IV203_036139 [Nitzschia inconspicua]|uniref:Uncharacterized protein n=1 Tax=Nitzschia inconspicua TaxID=303405 RepID=A0A9K3LEP2_9STRA|nr:hypothetical protein IV203_036139 [Nitzschia inconspicua]
MIGIAVAVLFNLLAAAAAAGALATPPQVLGMPMPGLRVDSSLGMKILSRARRLGEENGEEQGIDMTWVKNFSIKFQGCHYVQQFNDQRREGGGEGNAASDGVQLHQLVRFRLCPTKTCSSKNSQGCNSKYGDYVVGLDTFVNAYFEYQQRVDEYECELHQQNNCNCEDDGNQGEDFNAEYCEYDCFVAAGMEQRCVDRNPYDEEEGQEKDGLDVERYMECAEWEYDRRERRRLEDADAAAEEEGDEEEEEEEQRGSGLFIGPYCSGQGGAIYLGGFLDEDCTKFADKKNGVETFELLSGMELPFASDNIIRTETCLSCQNNANWEENGENNGQNDEVADLCQEVYYSAGKCEGKLPSGTVAEPNNNACSYIDGIQTFRYDGVPKAKSGNAGTTFFITLLILAIVALGFYVYYLRRRLAIKRENMRTVLLEPVENIRTHQVTNEYVIS